MVRDMTTYADDIVAAEIRAELARQRVTQIELAERLGVNRQWVARRLIGAVPLSIDDIARIAEALGVRVTSFTAPIDEQAQS